MNKSIETSLKLIGTYLMVCIIGSVLGGLIFMVYNLCANMVAGQSTIPYSGALFFHGILFFAPILIIFSGMFLVLSMIRHRIANGAAYIVYVLLLLVSWLIVIPLGNNNILAIESYESENLEREKLSSGYFRDYDGDIFYFSDVDDENRATGVLIEESNNMFYTFSEAGLKGADDGHFADSLIQSNVDTPKLLTILLNSYKVFYEISMNASRNGYKTWLCFASIGLALISVAGVKSLSHYSLVNALVVLYMSVFIVVFNIFGYTPSFMTALVTDANQFLVKIPGISHLVNPFIVVCNLFLTIIMGTIGLVRIIRGTEKAEFAAGFASSSDEEGKGE